MKKVLLIVNPVAGKMKLHSELFDIVEIFCKNQYQVTVAVTQYRGHGKELAASARAKGFDLVVCCGGDGTLNEAMSGLLEFSDVANIPLGYIPAGSTNDFANTLGIPTSPKEAAEAICKSGGTQFDVGKFNNSHNFSYIATFGAFSAASYSAPQELKNSIGHLAYLIEGLKQFTNMPKYQADIDADGKHYSGEFIYCSVSNTRSVGGVVKLSETIVDLHDGLFEVILVRYPKSITEIPKIISAIISSDFSGEMFEFFKAKDVTFTMPEGTAWSLDGEKVEAGRVVNIKNLAGAIEMWL